MADMSTIRPWEKPPKEKKSKVKFEPRDVTKEKVKKIVKLRDEERMPWRKIGDKMGMSHQGPFLLYQKWRTWARWNGS
jgi:hypothetical protein